MSTFFFFLTCISQIFVFWLHYFSCKKERKERTGRESTALFCTCDDPHVPLLSRPQVQEKGTYDLLAPLALLFYSTVLCVSSSTSRLGRREGRGRDGLTAPETTQRGKLSSGDLEMGVNPLMASERPP